jgi:hypothetical protein
MPIFKPGKGKWMKLCEKCGKPFLKQARCQKTCLDCQKENKSRLYAVKNSWITRYKNMINEFKILEKEINNKTLKQYHLILDAYKCGLKAHGLGFKYSTLAKDLGVSLTHLKRIISLKNCTSKTWELIEKGVISANKVAIITFEKGRARQDEIVSWAIETRASNIEIHHYLVSEKKANQRTLTDLQALKRYVKILTTRVKRISPTPEERGELITVLKECDEKIKEALHLLSTMP